MDHRLTSWSPFSSRGKEEEGDAEDLLRCIFPISPPPLPPPPDPPIRIYIHTSPLFSTGKKERGGDGWGRAFKPAAGGRGRRRRRRKLCLRGAQKGGKESRNSGGKGNPFISHFRFFSLSLSRSSPSHACQWQLKDPTLHSAAVRRCHTSLPQLIRKDSSVWLDFSQFFSSGFPPRPWERNYFIFLTGALPELNSPKSLFSSFSFFLPRRRMGRGERASWES